MTTVSVTIWPLTVMTRLLVSGGGVLVVVVEKVVEKPVEKKTVIVSKDQNNIQNKIKKVEEKATSEGINQPVSAWEFPNLRFTCDSCFDRNCLIRLPDDVSPCRCMTDSAIRNINRYHGLGRRCTSMSSTQYQRSLIRHPRL